MKPEEATPGLPVIWWRTVSAREGYVQPIDAEVLPGIWRGAIPHIRVKATIGGKEKARYVEAEQVWKREQEATV